MKITKSQLKQIIREELSEAPVLPRTHTLGSKGEDILNRLRMKGSFGRREPPTPEAEEDETDLLIAFQQLFDGWQPQTKEGARYKKELKLALRSATPAKD